MCFVFRADKADKESEVVDKKVTFEKFSLLEYVHHMRGEMNSNRYEISFRFKISLQSSVISLLVFTCIGAK